MTFTPDHARLTAEAATATLLLSATACWLASWFLNVAAHTPARLVRLRHMRGMPPSPLSSQIAFTTEPGRTFFPTDGRPWLLELTRPFSARIDASALPAAVLCHGERVLVVEDFTEDGVMIRGQQPGLWVEGWVAWAGETARLT